MFALAAISLSSSLILFLHAQVTYNFTVTQDELACSH